MGRRVVLKFPLNPGVTRVDVPASSKVVRVEEQHGVPTIWMECAVVEGRGPKVIRLFEYQATGREFDDTDLVHVGTTVGEVCLAHLRKGRLMAVDLTKFSHVQRPHVPALDARLGQPLLVHNEGFVRVVDYMGDDGSIVQAARVSYGDGTKSVSEDRGLIRYLYRHRHTTPFEMCELKLHLKMPVFVARQWVRHRMASLNEVSGRYSILPGEFFVPEPGTLAPQSTSNKQGRDGAYEGHEAAGIIELIAEAGQDAFNVYGALVEEDEGYGLARELSRVVLPLGTYTEFYWKIDLHNLLHFLKLRTDSHAQREIRDYADMVADIVKAWVPLAFEAWEDYSRNAVTFSAAEMVVIRKLVTRGRIASTVPLLDMAEEAGLRGREIAELTAKIGGTE